MGNDPDYIFLRRIHLGTRKLPARAERHRATPILTRANKQTWPKYHRLGMLPSSSGSSIPVVRPAASRPNRGIPSLMPCPTRRVRGPGLPIPGFNLRPRSASVG